MKHVFVTGQPGCGKTTLITKIASNLSANGIRLGGFYTEEVRYIPWLDATASLACVFLASNGFWTDITRKKAYEFLLLLLFVYV
jgi:hypothetical protein